MSIFKHNRSIGRLIVGAMSIDGVLDQDEREKVSQTLDTIGMPELIADVGAAIEEDDGTFNMFKECSFLVDSLGTDSKELSPIIFRIVADVVASDRYVSEREAAYLSALARRLKLSLDQAKSMFREVMAQRRGRLEVSGEHVLEEINPHLKDFLTFSGVDELVGELDPNSLEEMLESVTEGMNEGAAICRDELQRALAILGLSKSTRLSELDTAWREALEEINLSKMAELGDTFVSAAINKASRINEAYKIALRALEHIERGRNGHLAPLSAKELEEANAR